MKKTDRIMITPSGEEACFSCHAVDAQTLAHVIGGKPLESSEQRVIIELAPNSDLEVIAQMVREQMDGMLKFRFYHHSS